MPKPLTYSLSAAALIVAVAGAIWLIRPTATPVPPAPAPVVTDYGFGTSLRPLFAGKENGKTDARRLAGLLDALADAIERDGTRESPQLAHIASVYDLWKVATAGLMDGRGKDYPAFGSTIQAVIVKHHPDSGKPFDAPARDSIVSIFQAAAKACRKAGG